MTNFKYFRFDWSKNPERLKVVCQRHLEIMDTIETGDVKTASELIWQHLDESAEVNKPTNTE